MKRNRMPKGCLRARESGIFWCYWKRKGVPYSVSLGTRDRAEAGRRFRARMEEVRTAIRDGVFNEKFGHPGDIDFSDGDIRLSAAWRRYRKSVSRPDASEETLRQYEYQWDAFLAWARDSHPEVKLMSQVDKRVAKGFAADLAGRVSPNTFNKYVQLMRLVFRVLGDDVGLESNPWDCVRKRKVNGSSTGRRPFSNEELRRVFLTLRRRIEGVQLIWNNEGVQREHKLPGKERAKADEMLTLCLLGFHTGLRLGDCCLLRWRDIDLRARRIVATPLKTSRTSGRTVVIPLADELADRLGSLGPGDPEEFVCPLKAEQYRRNRSEVSKRFRVLFVQCGIEIYAEDPAPSGNAVPLVGFHSFRHTWVSQSAEAGVDAVTIRDVVGWGSPAMERVYTHLSPEHVERQLGKRAALTVMGDGIPEEEPTDSSDARLVKSMDDERLAEMAKIVETEIARRKV